MVSSRAASGHNLTPYRPPHEPLRSTCEGLSAVRHTSPSWSRPVDPLYPEPTGDRRWIAEQPLPWLGIIPRTGAHPELSDLVADGTVAAVAADLLLSLVRHRASVLVIAARSRAGKSTLLEALLPHYPEDDRRIRLRGSFETFGWEADDRFVPAHAVLIAEEISGHLPTYLWGPPVGRFLGWRDHGVAIAATAHGDSIEDVARLMAGYPLRLPISSVAAFDVIVRLGSPVDAPSRPSVLTDIWSTGRTLSGGLTSSTLFDHRSGVRYRELETSRLLGQEERPDRAIGQSIRGGPSRSGNS